MLYKTRPPWHLSTVNFPAPKHSSKRGTTYISLIFFLLDLVFFCGTGRPGVGWMIWIA